MELEPKSLGIPLEKRERWGLGLIVVCGLVFGVLWFVQRSFSVAFLASVVLVLPVIWAVVFPPFMLARRATLRGIPLFLQYGAVFGCLALAKSVLVPALMSALTRALA
jgi:hypothetical protein